MINGDGEGGEGSVDDAADQLKSDIAERLALLSTVVDTPTEFDQAGGSFDAREVDFDSDSWMTRISSLQGWLRLDGDLPTTSSQEFVTRLAVLIGIDPATAVEAGPGLSKLTVPGLNQLYERIDQAVRLQQIFVQVYENESASLPAATRAWVEAWEDEPDTDDVEPLAPVSAVADTWRISDFTGKKLNLTPSYQRGDVWGVTARQMLIESILRGIPLPSIILLRPEDPSEPYEVVDGKQRLTAILRFVGKHPLAVARVTAVDEQHGKDGELLKALQEDYPKFKTMWKELQHQQVTAKLEDEYFFPFRLRRNNHGLSGPLEHLQGKYFTDVLKKEIRAADERVHIKELFSGTPEYRIPVIVYKRASQSQIHEVFNLYNKQGMHLNAEEIRNAIFHELRLTRAILVASGDSDPGAEIGSISQPLVSVWEDVKHLGATLQSYGFGESRYRRSKVLAWIIASLLGDTHGKDLPSTARHIDDILKRAQNDASDLLNKPSVVGELLRTVAKAVEIHASLDEELWAPKFKDGGTGQKWQELQLVGSVLGVLLAFVAEPTDIELRIEAAAPALYAASATAERGERHSIWARPTKTQTRTQWKFIAQVAKAVADTLEVDLDLASDEVTRRFGTSGIASLMAVIDE